MIEHAASGSIRYGPVLITGTLRTSKLRLVTCRLSAGYGPCTPVFLTQEVIGQQRAVVQTQIPEIDVCCLFRLQHLDWNSFRRIHQIRISFDVIRFVEARSQQDEGTKCCTLLDLVAVLKPEGEMVSHTSRCGTDEVRLSAGEGRGFWIRAQIGLTKAHAGSDRAIFTLAFSSLVYFGHALAVDPVRRPREPDPVRSDERLPPGWLLRAPGWGGVLRSRLRARLRDWHRPLLW